MNWRDNLTYRDLSGRRRLRHYVSAALILVGFVAGLLLFTALLRQQYQSQINPTPLRSVQAQPGGTPRPPLLPATPTPTGDPCPRCPEAWTLDAVTPGSNFAALKPDCVLERMGDTIAWLLLLRMGYTRQEAAVALGFAQPPQQRDLGWITVNVPFNRAVHKVELRYDAPHPDLRGWRLDDGEHIPGFALQGCWRTPKSETFAVVCRVVEDTWSATTPTVYQLGEQISAFVDPQAGIQRTHYYLGYQRLDHGWVVLGFDAARMTLQTWEEVRQLREASRRLHGNPTWDRAWVESRYGLSARPVPPDWTAHTDPSERQAMADTLQAYLDQQGGSSTRLFVGED